MQIQEKDNITNYIYAFNDIKCVRRLHNDLVSTQLALGIAVELPKI